MARSWLSIFLVTVYVYTSSASGKPGTLDFQSTFHDLGTDYKFKKFKERPGMDFNLNKKIIFESSTKNKMDE